MITLIISAAVGIALPALVAFITKEALAAWLKQIILLFLAAVTGVLTSIASAPPSGWHAWEQVVVAILVAFVAAVQSQYGVREVHAVLASRTSRVGIGPRQP